MARVHQERHRVDACAIGRIGAQQRCHTRRDFVMKAPTAKPSLRCAIYTRVSTDARLEQEFNSLDAQREASEAYIKSQSNEGLVAGFELAMTTAASPAARWSALRCRDSYQRCRPNGST